MEMAARGCGAVLRTAAAWRLRTEVRSDRGRSDTGRLYGAARQQCRPGRPIRVRRMAAWPLTGGPHMSANFKYQKNLKISSLTRKIRYKVRKNLEKLMGVGNPIWNTFQYYNFFQIFTDFELFQRF
jgi:hypothetical protein